MPKNIELALRVLQLIDTLEAGGAERMAVNLANALVTEVNGSYLCTTRAEGLLKASLDSSVGYLFLKRTKTLDVSAVKRLVAYVKQEQITIVHAHASSFFIATLLKLYFPKVQFVWHDHYGNSQFVEERPKKMLKACSRLFYAIFAVNETLGQWDKRQLHCKQVEVVANFVTLQSCALETKLYGEPGKRIVCLANLRPQKDHINLVNAFNQVLEIHPDWTLHCVGKDFNDDYAKQVYTEVRRLGLEKQIYFYGSCPDVSAILKHMDIGVLSSKSEGLPLALLEYGFAELPVIATDVGDCNRVIVNTNIGRLVPASDANSLAVTLIKVIEDKQWRLNSSVALHHFVKKRYSKAGALKHVLQVYRQWTL
ncbi:glycosyltransferase [Formosa haliotis]|uniref:glycosyltransferase n=1 Tax=Formosa haliotis TaxID=1555194 RepID=UPI000A8DCB85|nr:glycosyltransferase [Formosa haliotis]